MSDQIDPDNPSDVLDTIAEGFVSKAGHAQRALDGRTDGLGHLAEKPDERLEERQEVYREAANRLRELATKLEDQS